jgi:hypothetical protein
MRTSTFALIAVASFAAAPAQAQSRDPYFATASANYDFVYHEPNATSAAGAHFDLAATVKRDVPFISVIGEIGVNHFDAGTISSFLGGARVRFPNAAARVLPFAQFAAGLYHCGVCGINDFAIQGGGGVDFKLASTDAVRVRAQVDIRHVFDTISAITPVRVSAGVVFPLNR